MFAHFGRVEKDQPARFNEGHMSLCLLVAQPAQSRPAFFGEKDFKQCGAVHKLAGERHGRRFFN